MNRPGAQWSTQRRTKAAGTGSDDEAHGDRSDSDSDSDSDEEEQPGAYAIRLGSDDDDSAHDLPTWDPTASNSTSPDISSTIPLRMGRRPSNGLTTIESIVSSAGSSSADMAYESYELVGRRRSSVRRPSGGILSVPSEHELRFLERRRSSVDSRLSLGALSQRDLSLVPSVAVSSVDASIDTSACGSMDLDYQGGKTASRTWIIGGVVFSLLIGTIIGIVIGIQRAQSADRADGNNDEQSTDTLAACNSFVHSTVLDRCRCGDLIEAVDAETQLALKQLQEKLEVHDVNNYNIERKCNDASSFALFWLATNNPSYSNRNSIIARYALAKFYFNFGPFGGNTTNWITSAHECDWFGVECGASGHVTGLSLRKNSLEGEVSLASMDSIVSLNLTKLDISENNLPGDLSFVLKMTNLEILDFSMNSLSGTVPTELAKLTKLIELRIDDNHQLSGIFPSDVFRMKTLEVIFVGGNPSMTGSLPEDLSNLSKLELLSLRETRMRGIIPSSIGLLANLTEIDFINSKKLEGSLPDEIGLLTGLTVLAVSDGGISGTIPSSIQKLTRLQELHISNMFLFGTLPEWLGTLTMLTKLALHSMGLSGTIPDELSNLKMLGKSELEVDSNTLICVYVSSSFRSTTVKLDLSGNMLTGTFPSFLSSLPNLSYVNFARTLISGEVPKELEECRYHLELGRQCSTTCETPPCSCNFVCAWD